jgi:hypothetical protein
MAFSSVVAAEVRCLVTLVGAAGDVFFLVEQLLQLRVGLLEQRLVLGLGRGVLAASGGRYDPARL